MIVMVANKHGPKDSRKIMAFIDVIDFMNLFHYGKNSLYLE